MADPLIFLLVIAIGGLAQVIDGSLGMGFGVFSSSMLMVAGFAPAVAVATVNAAKVFTGLASGLAHWRVGNVRVKWLVSLSASGVVGGFLGSYLLTSIPAQDTKPWISGFLLAMGLLLVLRSLRWREPCASQLWEETCDKCPKSGWQRVVEQARSGAAARLGALGFLAAFINGLSGAYGPIATSGVLLMEKGQPRHAVGTVNMAEFFVATTVASTILVRQGPGEFPTGLVLALAIGGLLAAPLAAYICRRMPARGLGFLVGTALIAQNFGVVALVR